MLKTSGFFTTNRSPRLRPIFATAALLSAGMVSATGLGPHNALFFGDFSSTFTDTEGSLAVQGNFTSGGYTVGMTLPNSHGASDSMIVGGDVNWHATGSVNNGNLRYGGNGDFSDAFNPTVNGGTRIHDVNTPAYFVPLQSQFTSLSTALTTLGNTVGDTIAYDQHSSKYGITLSSTATGTVIFNIDGSKFSAADGFAINAANASTILVNVDGVTNNLDSFGMTINGSSGGNAGRNVLFNMADTTSLTLTNIGFLGSLLAPSANVIGNSGQFDGQIIGKSFSGTTQIDDFSFTGSVPVPEPAPFAAFGLGALILCRTRRRSR